MTYLQFLLLFFPLYLICSNNEKHFRRSGESFYKKGNSSSPPKSKQPPPQSSPIEEIENIICPALEKISPGEAKRTYYFPPLEPKKPN